MALMFDEIQQPQLKSTNSEPDNLTWGIIFTLMTGGWFLLILVIIWIWNKIQTKRKDF